jgi:arginase
MQNQAIRIIGVPMDLGQARRGVDMGPSALRYAGLATRLRKLGHQVEDIGNLDVRVRDTLPAAGGLAFLPSVVYTCSLAYEHGRKAIADNIIPLFIGGDHSIAVGTVGGVTHDSPSGLLWIDAHGDFNTPESSPSGNIHGMPLAALMGRGDGALVNLGRTGPKLEPPDVVLFGVRDLDDQEKVLLRESGITIYTMRDIDERGITVVLHEAMDRLHHLPRLHVSLDMDCLDPWDAPGVGTPIPGGFTYREAHLIMELLADHGKVRSIDIVEINPILDQKNKTANIAAELLASLLGKSIL